MPVLPMDRSILLPAVATADVVEAIVSARAWPLQSGRADSCSERFRTRLSRSLNMLCPCQFGQTQII